MTLMNGLVVAVSLLLAQPSQAPAITFDPAVPAAANVHWTITLSAPYCGGFRIGDGVYIQPEAPLALPTAVAADAVLFDGQAADVLLEGDVLRVAPSSALAQSMLCQQGDRQFTVELLGSLGLANPGAGQYAVDVWLGSGGAPQKLPITVGAPSDGCDPLRKSVDAATATLQADNAALDKTFDAIRAQTAPLTAQAPNLIPAQTELVRQLAEVQAAGRANAANGWNPSIGYAAPAIAWAQGAAQADIAALHKSDGTPPSSVATVISLVQLAQQQAQDEDTASFQLMNVVQQFSDCELGVPPTAAPAGAAANTQSAGSGPSAPSGSVGTWSVQVNTPDWNKNLGVSATRQGCSSSPTDCFNLVRKVAQTANVRATLAVPLNATSTANNAVQYSKFSAGAPWLVEVGIDDFVSQYKALFPNANPSPNPAALVDKVIANLKSANPGLKFGATIYEDELASPYLQDARLPAATRGQFDYVHLFIHYRQDGPNYASAVQQAKQLFPNAHIIAGAYAVDRRAYLPCSPNGQPCTTQQELDLFSQTMTIQAQLLASKDVDSIEFFPGYFGTEDQWPGLSNPRECAPGDQANCLANTRAMRQAALTILGSAPPSIRGLPEVPSTTSP